MRILPATGLLIAITTAALQAAVQFNPIFSDHAVLQRERPVPVWGTADPNEKITVTFNGQSVTATADASGKWKAELSPMPAKSEPGDLVAKGASTSATATDVVIGDVWLASGQSNMDSPLRSGSAAKALPDANDPLLRFFKVKKAVSDTPLEKVEGAWLPSTSKNAEDFSAVAYFMASDLRKTKNIPIGVLNSAWGGTPIQTWLTAESIRKEPALSPTAADLEKAIATHNEVKNTPDLQANYLKDQDDWDKNVAPKWKAAKDAAKAAGQPAPQPDRPEPVAPDPFAMTSPTKRPSTPTAAYNGSIAPLVPFALKGIIWYQGEANGGTGILYRDQFPRLIEGWRAVWNRDDLPFVYVQLPGCYDDKKPVADGGWPFTREAQLMTLKVPNTAMVVTADIGDPKEVHPDNKSFVGERVARAVKKLAYGDPIISSGPLFSGAEFKDGKAVIKFTEIGSGLAIGEAPWRPAGIDPLPTDKLTGFYIAGNDKTWKEADAVIEGDTVVVSSASVPDPVAVRYAWAAYPRANLYNKDGLPASPFRTDDWPK